MADPLSLCPELTDRALLQCENCDPWGGLASVGQRHLPPLSKHPVSADEAIALARQKSVPVYLDQYLEAKSGLACAYPLSLSRPTLFQESLDEGQYNGTLYGAPTQISLRELKASHPTLPPFLKAHFHLQGTGDINSSIIFDPSSNYFYGAQLIDSAYGPQENLKLLDQGITELTEKNATRFQQEGWNFFAKNTSLQDEFWGEKTLYPKGMMARLNAQIEIELFLPYLKNNYPALAAEVIPLLRYLETVPSLGIITELACGHGGLDKAVAIADYPHISLLPEAIKLLAAKQYDLMASYLAHELAHHKASEANLELPLFTTAVWSNRRLLREMAQHPHRALLLSLLNYGEFLEKRMDCNSYGALYEDELSAITQEQLFSENHGLPQDPSSLDYENYQLEGAHHQFPDSSLELANQYLELTYQTLPRY